MVLLFSIPPTAHLESVPTPNAPPPPMREFRAAWVATVANIDWPSKPGLSSEQQKRELIAILDQAVALNLNAIILQVRPACDALYSSSYEPWSEFLTGHNGRAPEPFYDPLAFAVEEAHKRGLELHAWFNPYRASHPKGKSPPSAKHIRRRHPEIVRSYGEYHWLDPGEPGVQEHTLKVILDVVRRYDIDGVHIDDYFYPYRVKDKAGNIIDFPDEPSWNRYRAAGGRLNRNDWRRENVNTFVRQLYQAIKAEKRWVKFGISPFGIWRPGHPPPIQGFDQYTEIYADPRKWLRNGWLDYFTPQLYWRIDPPAQSYPVLLKWWVEQNTHHRHIWPGNYTSKVGEWPAQEIIRQIQCTRQQLGATGNVHFSMTALLKNVDGLSDLLKKEAYAQPALVPASPWLDDKPPSKPTIKQKGSMRKSACTVTWNLPGGKIPWLWVLQTYTNGQWQTQILPGLKNSKTFEPQEEVERVAVSAVDRCGNQGSVAILVRR